MSFPVSRIKIFFNDFSIISANKGTICCVFTEEGVARNNNVHIRRMNLCIFIFIKKPVRRQIKICFNAKLFILYAHVNGPMMLNLARTHSFDLNAAFLLMPG